jgi:GH25 family lysozyme M1 (1,4-beta-N-acetylmuramidase)
MRNVLMAAALLAVMGCGTTTPSDVVNEEDIDATADVEQEVVTCSNGSSVAGIDISHWNGSINWNAVRNSGKRFAYISIGDGRFFVDQTFNTNWAGAKAAGVYRGPYQYFRASQDPIAQANIIISRVGKLGPGDLPVMLDLEELDGASAATTINRIRTWLQAVQKGTGKVPVIYTNISTWTNQLLLGLPALRRQLASLLPEHPQLVEPVALLAVLGDRPGQRHVGRRRPRRLQRLGVDPQLVRGHRPRLHLRRRSLLRRQRREGRPALAVPLHRRRRQAREALLGWLRHPGRWRRGPLRCFERVPDRRWAVLRRQHDRRRSERPLQVHRRRAHRLEELRDVVQLHACRPERHLHVAASGPAASPPEFHPRHVLPSFE